MARDRGTERGMDRLIFFTDAVTAIAITLLILPLVDLVTQFADVHKGRDLAQFFDNDFSQIFSFLLSFVIIARFWVSNHGLLEHASYPTPALMWLNIGWAFTIVVLPLPTEIIAAFQTTPLTVGLYIGTMAANSLLLTGIAWVIYRRPDLEEDGHIASLTEVWGTGITAVIFLIALAIGLTIPHVTYWGLCLLIPTGLLDRLVKPRIRRWEAAKRVDVTAAS